MRGNFISDSKHESDSGNQQFLREIVNSRMHFPESLVISKESKYGDSVWRWDNRANLRLKLYKPSSLSIDWNGLKTYFNLTPNIIEDLKKYVFFRINYSTVIFPLTKKNAHPSPVVVEVRVLSRLLGKLRSLVSVSGRSLINDLSDIEVQDLRNALKDPSLSKDSRFRYILSNFASQTFSRHLNCGGVKWNRQDIRTLPWKVHKNKPYDRLSKELFSFLSNNAAADVKQFLNALKLKVQDESLVGNEKNIFLEDFEDFSYIFERYVSYRNALIRKDKESSDQFIEWIRRLGIKQGRINDLIERAVYAARIIIMLYTGARYSEFAGFKVNCLRRKGDFWVIAGTVIKHRDLTAPTDQDEWIAIAIVRDAVNVLRETARMANAIFLFHTCVSAFADRERFVDSHIVSFGIRRYIDIIDINEDWKDARPHPQQFRNSLAFEMRKASLGLPFITYQLKHAYSAFENMVSDTTLGYGAIGSDAVQKAIEDANLLAFEELYHPDSPVAGGGSEQHRKRRDKYFRAMAHRGMGVDEVLRFLAKEGGMPLTDVGLGYCQGQGSKIKIDDVKTDPPCIGQLRCNPVRCQNAVIPEHKLPAWEKSLEENRSRAEDPEFAYAREHLLEAATEAQSVIQFFQIEGRKRKKGV